MKKFAKFTLVTLAMIGAARAVKRRAADASVSA